MKNLKLLISLGLFLGVVMLCYQVITLSLETQVKQKDYAEINDIKYGLFSINQWKNQLAKIVGEEITKLNISSQDKKQLKPVLEKQLSALIDSVNEKIQNSNKKSFKGRVKQAFIETFVDIKDIKKGIPKYADDLIKVIEKPKTRDDLKGMLLEKVDNYFEKTFEEQDLSNINDIVKKMGVPDIATAKSQLGIQIEANLKIIFLKTWIILGLAILIFIIAALSKDNLPSSEYIIMVLTLSALLVTGVTTPMINLEAKITEMSFVLFDQPVQFLNQILYFQSKSVLDVFWIMITHPDLQMKIVGILMVGFSVVFPVFKLLSSLVYFYDFRRLRKNAVIRFFVLKSGKWSMTDVLIIAIFMAYIGFNGIISSQFGKMHSADREIVLLTTNGTSLQPGFYMFLGYAILALFLSEFLTSSPKPDKKIA